MADRLITSIRLAASTAIQASTSRSISRGAQEDATTRPRYLHPMVLAWLGLLVFAAGGCTSSSSPDPGGSCAPPPDLALINLGCVPIVPPVVTTSGPCSVCPIALANGSIPDGSHCAVGHNSENIWLIGTDAGTCHVELTFGSGATSSVDVDFASEWRALGFDPHGCGQAVVPVTADGGPCPPTGCQVSVPGAWCDAGLDASSSR